MDFLNKHKKLVIFGLIGLAIILYVSLHFIRYYNYYDIYEAISFLAYVFYPILVMVVIFEFQKNTSKEQGEVLTTAKKTIELANKEIEQARKDINRQSEVLTSAKKTIEEANKEIEQARIEINSQSEVLASAKQIIEEANQEIKTNNDWIKKVRDGQGIRVLHEFPKNIPFITDKLKEWSAKKDGVERRIIIATDVAGYGVVSDNIAFCEYLEVIRNIVNKTNIAIAWYFYDDAKQNEQSNEQFASYIPKSSESEKVKQEKLDKFKVWSGASKLKVYKADCNKDCSKCPNKERDCYIIKSIDEANPYSLPSVLDRLEGRIRGRLFAEDKIDLFFLKDKLPFFAWILYEPLEDDKANAIETIISYPAYKQGSTEKCFYTYIPDITQMYYSIVKDFTSENSVAPVKRENSNIAGGEQNHLAQITEQSQSI